MNNDPSFHYGDMFGEDKYVRQRYQIYLELLKPFLKDKEKVLDVGGYRGELGDLLPNSIRYYVLDFDKKALEEARKKGAITRKINFDQEVIKWPKEEPFDIVVATEVFEHLKDPARHLVEIKKLLKDDGILLVSLPNENMFYHRLVSLFGFGVDYFAFQLYKHLHLPTISQSRKFLEQEFKILKEDYLINVSARSSRFEFLGSFLTLFPDRFWYFLAHLWPEGFARGTVFLLSKK